MFAGGRIIAFTVLILTTLHGVLRGSVTTEKIDYQKWPDAWRLRNGACEMVVVPAVGRVMYFGLTGGKNILYNNEELGGQTVPRDDHQWHNFGGDKVWPTQQDWWIRYTDRKAWPPPYFSDAAPQTAEPIVGGLRMTSPKSPEFGTRTIREFVMDPEKPLVHVRQWFKKEDGTPVVMNLWTVTQVRTPDYAMLPLGKSIDGKPFKNISVEPSDAQVVGDVAVIRVDPKHPKKIGTAPAQPGGGFWVAAVVGDEMLVESRRDSQHGSYPDGNCSGEIFTADAGLKLYVELELLSPLREVKARGDMLRDDTVWQLTKIDPAQAGDPSKAAKVARSLHSAALDQLSDTPK